MKMLLDLPQQHNNSACTAFICIVFFLIGFITAPNNNNNNNNNNNDGSTNVILSSALHFDDNIIETKQDSGGGGGGGFGIASSTIRRQRNAHYEFQSKIDRIQNPTSLSSSTASPATAGTVRASSSCHRILRATAKSTLKPIGANPYEEFARSFHYLSLSLQVSVATERTLVLDNEWTLLFRKVPAGDGDDEDGENKEEEECGFVHWNDKDDKQEAIVVESGCLRLDAIRMKSISCLQRAITSKVCTNEKDNNNNSKHKISPPKDKAAAAAKKGTDQDTSSSSSSSLLSSSSLAFGIIPDVPITKSNSLFHAEYYGKQQPIVEMPSWPFPKETYLIDVVPTWERLFGRFWIRSQMVHYLWEQWQGDYDVASSSSSSSSHTTTSSDNPKNNNNNNNNGNNKPIIAFYWISCKKLRKNLATKYGRNATVTQNFDRYMMIATRIRKQHSSQLSSSSDDDQKLDTIYLITDGEEEEDSGSNTGGGGGAVPIPDMKELKQRYPIWNFVKSCSSPTITTTPSSSSPSLKETQRRHQNIMLAKLETMRKVDYLVGSFQSQMFRLAAELNAAYFLGGGGGGGMNTASRRSSSSSSSRKRSYPTSMRRHWAVDVEWFENP